MLGTAAVAGIRGSTRRHAEIRVLRLIATELEVRPVNRLVVPLQFQVAGPLGMRDRNPFSGTQFLERSFAVLVHAVGVVARNLRLPALVTEILTRGDQQVDPAGTLFLVSLRRPEHLLPSCNCHLGFSLDIEKWDPTRA